MDGVDFSPPDLDRAACRTPDAAMDPWSLFALAFGAFAFGVVSRRAEAGVLTTPMAFAAFGLIVGAGGLGLLSLDVEGSVVEALAEVTLVVALFTDASRIDLRRLGRRHDLPIRLLGIGLPLTMAAGAGLALLLFPGLGLWPAVVLGVIPAPTDAALGQAVVSNESVPERIRQGLNVESGLNDGLAFPALLVAASLAGGERGRRGSGPHGLGGLRRGPADPGAARRPGRGMARLARGGVGGRAGLDERGVPAHGDAVARAAGLRGRGAAGRQRLHRGLPAASRPARDRAACWTAWRTSARPRGSSSR